MYIDDRNSQKQLSSLGLGLTSSEARELRDALEDLLAGPADRHEHVSSSDYQTELTVWILPEARTPAE